MAPVLFLISIPSEDDESYEESRNVIETKEIELTFPGTTTTATITTTIIDSCTVTLKNEVPEKDVEDSTKPEDGEEKSIKNEDTKTDEVQEHEQGEESGFSDDSSDDQQPTQKPKKKRGIKRATSFYDMAKGCKIILKKFKVQRAAWLKTDNGKFWQVMFHMDNERVDSMLYHFLKAGIGNNEYTSVSVVPITVNFPSMMLDDDDLLQSSDSDDDTDKTEKNACVQFIKSRLTVAQVISTVKRGSQLTFDYIMLLILSSMIAAIGLLEDSAVLLVAGMLVSPIMSPIQGGTFGLRLQYKPLWKPAMLNELLGLLVCLIVGFVFGIFCGLGIFRDWNIVTSEMISRGQYRSLYVGLFVAIPSGAAVALSILGGDVGSVVGVTISASLLPPAVNAGIFWAFAIICGINGPKPHAAASTTSFINPFNVSSIAAAQLISIASKRQTLRDFLPTDLAKLGAISGAMTISNVLVIFVMCVVILKIKNQSIDEIEEEKFIQLLTNNQKIV